jgi:hypothetical protein
MESNKEATLFDRSICTISIARDSSIEIETIILHNVECDQGGNRKHRMDCAQKAEQESTVCDARKNGTRKHRIGCAQKAE